MAEELSFVPQAVVGVDIGTSASGYAFAFCDTPGSIHHGNLSGHGKYHKAPTVLWTSPNFEFRAFGNEAYEGYSQDSFLDREESKLFSHYKLLLVGADTDPMIRLKDGSEYPMLDVMTKTILHIKENAFDKLRSTLGSILNEQRIVWVITVPAIWSEFSKHFMRRAAFQAGLMDTEDSSRLILAMEPEAAVASCIHDMNPVLKLPNGTKFIMLDCGGGTIDITSHVIASGGVNDNVESCNEPLCLNELVAPRGGDWGSMRVDENFLNQILKPLLGPTLFQKFQTCHECKHQLLEEFEGKLKKKHGPQKKSVRLNFSSLDEVFEDEEITLKDLIEEYNAKVTDDTMHLELISHTTVKFTHEIVCSLFDPLLDAMMNEILSMLKEEKLQGLSQVFLVGGFGESLYLQDRVLRELKPYRIELTLSPCPGSCVMLGAVRFALFPELFSSRVSKFTYGVGAIVDGKSDMLDVFVSCGQEVPYGLNVERVYRPASPSQESITIQIVGSTNPNTVDMFDHSVKHISSFRAQVPMDIPHSDRQIKISMNFGSTEISAVASIIGGDVVKSVINFNRNDECIIHRSVEQVEESRSVHFVIDTSLSMDCPTSQGRTRLDDVKEGVHHVIKKALNTKSRLAMSSFDHHFHLLFEETELEQAPLEMIDQLKPDGATRLYSSCITQLQQIEAIQKKEIEDGNMNHNMKRFLIVFTDGQDNSRESFRDNADFVALHDMLQEDEGVCSHLAGLILITVGLDALALRPLDILAESGKLKMLNFKNTSDILKAFQIASEEIEKICDEDDLLFVNIVEEDVSQSMEAMVNAAAIEQD